jgi:hypothetical protein
MEYKGYIGKVEIDEEAGILHNELSNASKQVSVVIQRLSSSRPEPFVVAIDGGSGAGKSTLASVIGGQFDVALIHLDDFFSAGIPDDQWDRFTIEERLEFVFDRRRARLAAREDQVFLTVWHRRWDPVEAHYFTHVRPRSFFDLIVTLE